MRAAAILAAPAFTWTGGYIGVNAGAAWNRDHRTGYAPGAITFPAGAGGPASPFQATFFTASPAFNGTTSAGTPFITVATGLPVGTVVPLPGTCGNCGNRNQTTGLFGVQWGYNLQLSPGSGFVIGYESDLQYSGLGRNKGQPAVCDRHYHDDPGVRRHASDWPFRKRTGSAWT